MNKRKFLTRGLIVLVALGVGLATYFLVPKVSADTTTKTITVSGKVTDIALVPIAGAHLIIKPVGGNSNSSVETYSGNDGRYKIDLSVEIDDSGSDPSIDVLVSSPRYLPWGTAFYSSDSRAVDFVLSRIPQDTPSSRVLDLVSARCRIKNNPQDFAYLEHTGDYTGKVINGELFCTAENPQVFTTYASQIDTVSKQVAALSARTGLNYIPTIYLTGRISWLYSMVYPLAYTDTGREIVIDVNALNIATITHEYGHLVDWYTGWDELPRGSVCRLNIAKTKAHCGSSNNKSFVSAFGIATKQIFPDYGNYATSNFMEMFTEIFTAQEIPDSPGNNNFNIRLQTKLFFTTVPVGAGTFRFDQSYIDIPASTSQQNAVMYIYKFVATKSRLDGFFPGSIGNWSYNDILSGKYMNLPVKPTATIQPVSNISTTAVTLNGLSTGSSTGRGFFYGLDNAGPTDSPCKSTQYANMTDMSTSTDGTGAFSSNITNLVPNEKYCVFAYALPNVGSVISFKTASVATTPLDPCNIAPQITALSPPSLTVGASNPSPVITTRYKITSMAPAGCTQRMQLSESMDMSKFPANLKLTSTVIKSGSQSGSPIDISLSPGASDYATATIQLTKTQPTTALPFGPLTPVVFKAEILASP